MMEELFTRIQARIFAGIPSHHAAGHDAAALVATLTFSDRLILSRWPMLVLQSQLNLFANNVEVRESKLSISHLQSKSMMR